MRRRDASKYIVLEQYTIDASLAQLQHQTPFRDPAGYDDPTLLDVSAFLLRHVSSHSSQSLPQPVAQFRLAQLGEVIDALFAEIDILELSDILCRRPADALHDDGRIRFENDAIVDNFVEREADKVVVFENGSLVDGLSALTLALCSKRPRCYLGPKHK